MYISINIASIIAIAISIIVIIGTMSLFIEASIKDRLANPKFVIIIFSILIVCTGVLICNIDYNKSTPAEVYTEENLTESYNAGYDAGIKEAYTTTEDWFSNLQNVTISEDNSTIHLIDENGEEWVLVSDDYQNQLLDLSKSLNYSI